MSSIGINARCLTARRISVCGEGDERIAGNAAGRPGQDQPGKQLYPSSTGRMLVTAKPYNAGLYCEHGGDSDEMEWSGKCLVADQQTTKSSAIAGTYCAVASTRSAKLSTYETERSCGIEGAEIASTR